MSNHEIEVITLGGGCFWCVEAVFEQIRGVRKVTSGYSGGTTANPTYNEVCGGRTGHAEVVQVEFDPHTVSLQDLLEVFFTTHDPTTLNQQGADIGTQYRSIVLYHTDDQKTVAEKVIRNFEEGAVWGSPLVTELKPLESFYPAEDEHKNYYMRNPNQSYCLAVIAPKVAKLRKMHLQKLKSPDEANSAQNIPSHDRSQR